ncbi:hypothetical protein Pla22_14140 [Rubripirellula amarantea]|uniref:Uncharacterized protein n=1 Tax=Rubripirellula amarantea TaxID=2527999 RepID=A0A5C5WUL4_9BACT|nr:hypothetical protein Pla22_14140 [Rubripirellula amarantea]
MSRLMFATGNEDMASFSMDVECNNLTCDALVNVALTDDSLVSGILVSGISISGIALTRGQSCCFLGNGITVGTEKDQVVRKEHRVDSKSDFGFDASIFKTDGFVGRDASLVTKGESQRRTSASKDREPSAKLRERSD